MNAPSASPDGLVAVGTLAVVGVGLIGGSFAAALRRAGLVGRVIGAGRRPETLAQAMSLGVIDEAVTLTEAARQADFIFIAAPVGAFAPIFGNRLLDGYLACHGICSWRSLSYFDCG